MATGKNLTASSTYDVAVQGELNVTGTGTSTIQGNLASMGVLTVGASASSTIRGTTATSTLGGLIANHVSVTKALTISGGGTSTFTGGIFADAFRFNLPSCDSLDTDSTGAIICGSDANSGGVNDWGTFITMATGKNLTASSTYDVAVQGELNVTGTGTSTIQGNLASMGVLTVGASASSTIRGTTATSTLGGLIANHVIVTKALTISGGGTSTFTGGIFADAFRTNLPSCDSLDTNASGAIVCGSDDTGGSSNIFSTFI